LKILGIHDGHNAAACLFEDGEILGAVQEDRLSRIKNHDTFPARSIRWLLDYFNMDIESIDAVAMNGFHMPLHRSRSQLIDDTRQRGTRRPSRILRRWARATPLLDRWRHQCRQRREKEAADVRIPPGKLVYIEHHRCHAEAACWGSPFRGKPVLVMTADGAGDDLCATVNTADEQGRIRRLESIHESHSPALVYLTVTTLLGMVPNEHEYKLMGMAPYGGEKQSREIVSILDQLVEWELERPMKWCRRRGIPDFYHVYDLLKHRLDMKRFDHVCGGLQMWTEQLLVEWVRRAVRETGIQRVALSGGIFMNVKANQAIATLPEVEELFVFPSCGDETNAMGAAFAHYAEVCSASDPPIRPVQSVYWGPDADRTEINAALNGLEDQFEVEQPHDINRHAAGFLARGEVVARFAGRAEFGARALGNRSILADPSRPGVVQQINDMIKCRDFWMPFACTLLADRAEEYVRNPKHLSAPYMIITMDSTDKVDRIAAGSHPRDHTVRPQILEREWNPDYFDLIRAFEELSGIGGLLNTSFNLHGYPIVNSPAEALDVMRKSGLNYLILGDHWISRKPAMVD
jgi:carbamoyltransferase